MSRDVYAQRQARRADPLETLWMEGLPEEVVPAFEAALQRVCPSVAIFRDEVTDTWRVEGVRPCGQGEEELAGALALASLVSGGFEPVLQAAPVEAEGWLARTVAAFGEQEIGGAYLVRPTHLPERRIYGREVLKLDAGIAFGSGEHGSTRGCLVAFAAVARGGRARRLRRLLDLGTGSGILAMAAAKRLRRPVLATDIEPWSVRVAEENARMNGVGRLVRARLADGWRDRHVRAGRPYDLVFANILARPLCSMAKDLSVGLAPGGTAILAGLLGTQVRMVLAAHRRRGMVLERRLPQGAWATLVLRRR
ncbi:MULTISPECIES: 50S ribosomal protein L11 methyltransferase [Roseomonadaceae]|uniref:50S ribosomal protein L11 methyltransferase n=1 Tax=Falsiroseomonas oleicola TaxID=2801474 RepID=A0ABS6H5E7_9PROT|nr:50S ribosomal protein L11 methyltransferase [Roseomonas oleicola]MBU8543621.1 50S ribosomal protein L11 methyltransferase [Roseomonas oleicola]